VSVSKTTIIATIVVVLTFVAGFAVGMFSAHMIMLYGGPGAPPFPAKAMVNRLDRHLDLDDAQRAKVQEIIKRRHARIAATWSSVRPRVSEEIDRANAEIDAVLTPEQRAKFAKMKMRLGRRGSPPHHRIPVPE
jgi:Spy/CpxP family protein refolding chaperone